jgi:hypothetical protein
LRFAGLPKRLRSHPSVKHSRCLSSLQHSVPRSGRVRRGGYTSETRSRSAGHTLTLRVAAQAAAVLHAVVNGVIAGLRRLVKLASDGPYNKALGLSLGNLPLCSTQLEWYSAWHCGSDPRQIGDSDGLPIPGKLGWVPHPRQMAPGDGFPIPGKWGWGRGWGSGVPCPGQGRVGDRSRRRQACRA